MKLLDKLFGRTPKVGDTVRTMYGEKEKVLAVRPAQWAPTGQDLLIEINEPFPYIGRPNPRRRVWFHESWTE